MRCGACLEPALYFVFLSNSTILPAHRCRQHTLDQLLDGAHGVYRVFSITPIPTFSPIPERVT